MKKTKKLLALIILITCATINCNAQWQDFVGNTITTTEWLGATNTSTIDFNLEHRGTNNINFLLGTTQAVTIQGAGATNPYYVGIGVALSPSYRLDVDDDININTNASNPPLSGYRINGVPVFQVPLNFPKNIFIGPNIASGMTLTGNAENVFVGQDIAYQQTATGPYTPGVGDFNVCVGTGVAIGMSDYCVNNVFIGWRSAYSNVGSGGCVYIGRESGYSDIGSDVNVFVGLKSGYSTVNAGANTFIGAYSGYSNVNGGGNTFIGETSGYFNLGSNNTFGGIGSGNHNTIGTLNSFWGAYSGFTNTRGSYNTFMGARAGFLNEAADTNVFVGYKSGYSNNTGGSASDGINNAFSGGRSGENNISGNANSFFGSRSGFNNTDGSHNSFFGTDAGHHNTIGDLNTFIGSDAGFKNGDVSSDAGVLNTFIGAQSGFSNIIGDSNVFVGNIAGYLNTSNGNTFIGYQCGSSNTSATENTFTGNAAGRDNIQSYNTFNGSYAGMKNTTGRYNSFFGNRAGESNTNESACSFFGQMSGLNSNGSANSFFGYHSGITNTTGATNTAIGFQADFSSATLSNSAAIGANAIVGASNSMILGNKIVNVGIGVPNNIPAARLDVYSNATNPLIANPLIAGNFYNTSSTAFSGIQTYMGVNASCDVSHFTSLPAKGPINIGGNFSASNTKINIGVNGNAAGMAGNNFGGYFSAQNAPGTNYGVYASSPVNPTSWALWSNGHYYSTGSWYPSDSILKNGIATITNPFAILNQAKPRQYYYDTITYSYMNLPSDIQYGLVAQEFESVLPAYVMHTTLPAEYDTSGTMIHDSLNFSVINYQGILPYLIAGVQQLDSLQSRRPKTVENAIWMDTLETIEWGTNPLIHDTEVPMIDGSANAWSIYYSGQSDMQNSGNPGNIGVGYNYLDPLEAKLDVLNMTQTDLGAGNPYSYTNPIAGKFYTGGTYDDPYTDGAFIGVSGTSVVSTSTADVIHINMGGSFLGRYGLSNYGVKANGKGNTDSDFSFGVHATASLGTNATGVLGLADGGDNSIGVSGKAKNGITLNYGIYGSLIPVTGASNYAGYFGGDVYTTGSYLPSDASLKQNIQPFSGDSALYFLQHLNPKSYSFNTNANPSMNLPAGHQYGLLSDDMLQLLPGMVKDAVQPAVYDTLGNVITPEFHFKALNYTALIPLLIAGEKKLGSENQLLQQQNIQLFEMLNNIQQQLNELQDCCDRHTPGEGNRSTNQSIVELNDLSILLDQNAPNPFAEKTSIHYIIPESVTDAKIIFYTSNGTVLKTVQINERGEGNLLVYASNLSSGIYSYSLIADGKLIDTKKMVCEK